MIQDLAHLMREPLARIGHGAQVALREEIRWGDRPTDEILRYAQDQQPDLLILGTHGYGGFMRAITGSVASVGARRAPIPVLLVPPTRGRSRSDGAVQ